MKLTVRIARICKGFVVVASCAAIVTTGLPPAMVSADTLGYPDHDAADCSDQHGPSSWCKNGNYNSPRGYGYRNCTDFVAWKLQSANEFYAIGGYGNAYAWGTIAGQKGYTVNGAPERGSIAWKSSGAGHVAWVESVDGDYIKVQEYNYDFKGNGRTKTYNKSAFTGFIHFKDMTAPTPVPFMTHPSAIHRGNGMDVFYKEHDGGLANVGWEPGSGWRGPQVIAGNLAGNPDAIARGTNDMEVAFVDTAGNLRTVGWNTAQGWGSAIVRANDVIGDPEIITRGNGMELFWRTDSGSLMTRGWSPDNGWMATRELATGVDSNPSAVARGTNAMDVFYRDGHNLVNVGWDANRSTNGGWSNPATRVHNQVTGDPAAISRSSNEMSIFYRDRGNNLDEKGWGAGSGWRPVATHSYGDVLSDPSATPRSWKAMEVAYRSDNNTVKTVGWHVNTGWNQPHVRGSGIYGEPHIIIRGTRVMEVFYKQTDHLTDAGWNAGVGWGETDIAGTNGIH